MKLIVTTLKDNITTTYEDITDVEVGYGVLTFWSDHGLGHFTLNEIKFVVKPA